MRANNVLKKRIELFFQNMLGDMNLKKHVIRYLYFEEGKLIVILSSPLEESNFNDEYKFKDGFGTIKLIKINEVNILIKFQ